MALTRIVQLTDLHLYTEAVAEGPAIIAGIRADHPIGSLVRSGDHF